MNFDTEWCYPLFWGSFKKAYILKISLEIAQEENNKVSCIIFKYWT